MPPSYARTTASRRWDTELEIDGFHMRLDGVDGDIQLGGDLAGRQHGGKVGENLQLPVTELVRPAVGRFQALETDDGSDAFHVARTSASTSSSGVGLPAWI
jgi:hypothetical protein